MATRATKETLYLRRDFTPDERLEMGRELAQAHNRLAAIDDEEKSMKATVKERRTGIELTVGSLSRKLNDGYEMENQPCSLTYDEPNIGEVTFRDPSGKIVKQRAMTISERQEELPFEERTDVIPPAKSAENIAEFFGDQEKTATDQPEPIKTESSAETDNISDESEEVRASYDSLAAAEVQPHSLPDGFEDGVRTAMGLPEPFPATLGEQLAVAEKMDTSKPGKSKRGAKAQPEKSSPVEEVW